MITLGIILLLVFVPASRRILLGTLSNILAVLGIVFLTARSSERQERF